MNGLVWVGFGAFFVVASTVGVRLLLLWRRTRQLPELLPSVLRTGIVMALESEISVGVLDDDGRPAAPSRVVVRVERARR